MKLNTGIPFKRIRGDWLTRFLIYYEIWTKSTDLNKRYSTKRSHKITILPGLLKNMKIFKWKQGGIMNYRVRWRSVAVAVMAVRNNYVRKGSACADDVFFSTSLSGHFFIKNHQLKFSTRFLSCLPVPQLRLEVFQDVFTSLQGLISVN